MRDFKLEKSWKELLGSELKKTYMSDLRTFLVQEEKAQKTVYPQSQDILAALNLTPFDQVKVVILGQDPYHGPNQAHGLRNCSLVICHGWSIAAVNYPEPA